MLNEVISKKNIYIYGLSTETERVLAEWNGKYNVIGLLDGFKTSGTQYGYPIVDINDVVQEENVIIIVVARPGSCKAIAKRIGDLCRENNVDLLDIRGKDLLADTRVVYDFTAAQGYTRQDLLSAIENVKVVSFDLFDTLAIRNISSFESVLKLVDARFREQGVNIPDFVTKRLKAEKMLSFNNAPRLVEIYSKVLKDSDGVSFSANELASIEFEVDKNLIEARRDVVDLLNNLVKQNKQVYITSDSYYAKEQISQILKRIDVASVTDVLVSCEYGTSKTGTLFEKLKDVSGEVDILHVGDDIVADIESAKRHGINAFQIYSAAELLELVGGLKLSENEHSLSDQIKVGMFVANLFNSPFQFEDDEKRIHAEDAKDVGYLFCAPMIMDFTFEEYLDSCKDGLPDLLFCPGGSRGADNLAACKKLLAHLEEAWDKGKFVSAICASPAVVLGKTKILDGKKWTCYPQMQDNAKAEYLNAYCDKVFVSDGNLITSRGAGAAEEFAMELVRLLAGPESAEKIRKGTLQR